MRPYDERFTALLGAAARVFAERGYDRTTMRDLAAASGMSLAGMYYYVRAKEDLLYHVQERCFTQVLEGAETALAATRDPLERLATFIRHHVAFFTGHMPEMKVLSHEAAALTGERLRAINRIKRRYVDRLQELLHDAAPDQAPPQGAPGREQGGIERGPASGIAARRRARPAARGALGGRLRPVRHDELDLQLV